MEKIPKRNFGLAVSSVLPSVFEVEASDVAFLFTAGDAIGASGENVEVGATAGFADGVFVKIAVGEAVGAFLVSARVLDGV